MALVNFDACMCVRVFVCVDDDDDDARCVLYRHIYGEDGVASSSA